MFRVPFHAVLAAALVLLAAQLSYLRTRGDLPRPVPAEPWLMEASLSPVEWLRWPYRQAVRLGRRYLGLVGVGRENEALRGRLEDLEREVLRLREAERERDRLRGLLRFQERIGLSARGTDVLLRLSDGIDTTLYVRAGSGTGVRRYDAAASAEGLIGRVISVSPSYSKILPITDHLSAVGALDERSRVQGVLRGVGRHRCRLEHVPVESNVAVGDALLTSGVDGVFPKGIPLGTVSRVERPSGGFFLDIEVVPSVRLSSVEEVLILSRPVAGPGLDPDE